VSAAVEVDRLVKVFPAPDGGDLRSVDDISFDVREGEIFGILGPNGAGKTTTLEIVEGLTEATSGRTAVLGLDSRRDRGRMKERIGVQLQASAYFDNLALDEILDLFGSFYPRAFPPDELLARVGLLEKRKAKIKELSGGQAQRFSIVAALVNDPEVVFLDEPTTGLDPQARRNLWDVVREIDADGKTVVLTTHYMEEAEELCDRVAIVDRGRIVRRGALAELLQESLALDLALGSCDEATLRLIEEYGAIEAREERNLRVRLDILDDVPRLVDTLVRAGVAVYGVTPHRRSLEDVFLGAVEGGTE